MDVERAKDYEGPLPQPNATERPFWEAAARGELRTQRCPACGHRQHYPRPLCTACGAEPEWETLSGRGRVHTFTVVRQNGAKPFRDTLPYVVAMIETDEGVRMMGNVTDTEPDAVRIGMVVEAYAVQVADEIGIPYWRPARPDR